ncbi:hypothetical protein G7046_g4101 [Stylonectria norvegica]|nr:hypothetical protein G7046_g4101 [Stylonectria norvegica]
MVVSRDGSSPALASMPPAALSWTLRLISTTHHGACEGTVHSRGHSIGTVPRIQGASKRALVRGDGAISMIACGPMCEVFENAVPGKADEAKRGRSRRAIHGFHHLAVQRLATRCSCHARALSRRAISRGNVLVALGGTTAGRNKRQVLKASTLAGASPPRW